MCTCSCSTFRHQLNGCGNMQGYTGQQRGSDVHMSEAHPAEADRRTDRRGRGSRERSDMRRQRIDDRAPPAVDTSRYPSARDHQVCGHTSLHMVYLNQLSIMSCITALSWRCSSAAWTLLNIHIETSQ